MCTTPSLRELALGSQSHSRLPVDELIPCTKAWERDSNNRPNSHTLAPSNHPIKLLQAITKKLSPWLESWKSMRDMYFNCFEEKWISLHGLLLKLEIKIIIALHLNPGSCTSLCQWCVLTLAHQNQESCVGTQLDNDERHLLKLTRNQTVSNNARNEWQNILFGANMI